MATVGANVKADADGEDEVDEDLPPPCKYWAWRAGVRVPPVCTWLAQHNGIPYPQYYLTTNIPPRCMGCRACDVIVQRTRRDAWAKARRHPGRGGAHACARSAGDEDAVAHNAATYAVAERIRQYIVCTSEEGVAALRMLATSTTASGGGGVDAGVTHPRLEWCIHVTGSPMPPESQERFAMLASSGLPQRVVNVALNAHTVEEAHAWRAAVHTFLPTIHTLDVCTGASLFCDPVGARTLVRLLMETRDTCTMSVKLCTEAACGCADVIRARARDVAPRVFLRRLGQPTRILADPVALGGLRSSLPNAAFVVACACKTLLAAVHLARRDWTTGHTRAQVHRQLFADLDCDAQRDLVSLTLREAAYVRRSPALAARVRRRAAARERAVPPVTAVTAVTAVPAAGV